MNNLNTKKTIILYISLQVASILTGPSESELRKIESQIDDELQYVHENSPNEKCIRTIFSQKQISNDLHSIILNYLKDKHLIVKHSIKHSRFDELKKKSRTFSDGSKILEIVGNRVIIKDLKTNNNILTLTGAKNCTDAIVLNDAEVVTCSNTGTITIWDLVNQNYSTVCLSENNIISLSQLPNGSLVTISYSNLMDVWNVKASGYECVESIFLYEDIEEITSSAEGQIFCRCSNGSFVTLQAVEFDIIQSDDISVNTAVLNQEQDKPCKGCCCIQ